LSAGVEELFGRWRGLHILRNVSSEFIFMAAALLFLQVFQLFDVKRNGVIEFGEFVRSLSVFHPHAQNEEKMECETITTTTPTAASVSASFLFMHDLSPQGPRKKSDYFRTPDSGHLKLLSDVSGLGCSVVVFSVFIIAVAFKLYDLHQTGYIEREEVFTIYRHTLDSTHKFVFFSCSFSKPSKEKKMRLCFK
jgi:hypothetical protein